MDELARFYDIPGDWPSFYMVVADGGVIAAPLENEHTLRGVESLRRVSRLLGISDSGIAYPYQPVKYLAFDSEQDRNRWTRDIDGSPATDRLANQIRSDGD